MNEKMKNMLKRKDSAAEKLQEEKSEWERNTKIILTAIMIIGVIAAIIISMCVSEYYEGRLNHSEITVEFMGLVFDIDAETNVFVSPFMIFLYVVIAFAVIVGILWIITRALTLMIETKLYILEDTFRTNQLLELLVEFNCEESDTTDKEKAD